MTFSPYYNFYTMRYVFVLVLFLTATPVLSQSDIEMSQVETVVRYFVRTAGNDLYVDPRPLSKRYQADLNRPQFVDSDSAWVPIRQLAIESAGARPFDVELLAACAAGNVRLATAEHYPLEVPDESPLECLKLPEFAGIVIGTFEELRASSLSNCDSCTEVEVMEVTPNKNFVYRLILTTGSDGKWEVSEISTIAGSLE